MSTAVDIAALRARHPEHARMAAALRVLTLDAVAAANSGHSGMPMGMADVATVLFRKHLRFVAADPAWADRDRFVLSAGHGSMLLYGLLHLTGVKDVPIEELRNFRQLGARTAGHPEFGHCPGVETTTGPLGQGLANAVGMAIAERSLAARFGRVVDHRTWVIAGDGCLMEGVSQEAITLAGHLKLNRLVVLFDDNGVSIDGPVSLADRTDQRARFASAGWDVLDVDGHDPDAVDAALTAAKRAERPVMIACRTRIGLGAPTKEGTAPAHGAITDKDEIAGARAAYGWEAGPFEIPADVAALWAAAGRRCAGERAEWDTRLAALSERRRAEFLRCMAGEPPAKLASAVRALKRTLSAEAPALATRVASQRALEAINPVMPETLGGSADLTGSNNTRTKGLDVFGPQNPAGRYIHYGIREHAMAAAMNGMAAHGGVAPYGGTFLVFSDYARPAIRLSALMGLRVVHVLTHDSIGLGEDGPTHQPVEHLAMLRATPNLAVFRPADAVETAEAWELALSSASMPSALALTRQNLPTLRTTHTAKNLVAQGAYVIAEAQAKRRVVLLATGSEVEIAMAARALLEAEGIGARVVSMPCWELFEAQPEAYRKRVLPRGPVRVAVEAAVRQGWDRWLCGEGGDSRKAGFVGMEGFGASAPYKALYGHFGITAEAVAAKARALL